MGWPVEVVDVTGSTNADLVARARAGEQGPVWLVAHEQTRGRGRLGRAWTSAPGGSLAMSVLWRPAPPQARWTWLPPAVGLGVVDGLAACGVVAALKWPNDVVVSRSTAGDDRPGALAGLRKLAGILVEVVPVPGGDGATVVAGVGVNLRTPPAGAAPHATSVADLTGTTPAADAVADATVTAVTAWLQGWEADGGDPAPRLRAAYRRACTTLGRQVRVLTQAGTTAGTAVDVDEDGALVLLTGHGPVAVSAGDVEHVR